MVAWIKQAGSNSFSDFAREAVHAEGALRKRGDSSEPGSGDGGQGAGGEVPAVRGGAGALLRHVRGVHRGQGPKTAGAALFPHFPSEVSL